MRTKSPIHELVREAHVAYAVVARRSAFSTAEDATETFIRAHNYAKVLIYFVDGEPIEAVLPEAMTVNLDRLRELANGHDIRLAQHEELEQLFPDREAGITPSANTASRPLVFVDVALAAEAELLFDVDVIQRDNPNPLARLCRNRPADCRQVRGVSGRSRGRLQIVVPGVAAASIVPSAAWLPQPGVGKRPESRTRRPALCPANSRRPASVHGSEKTAVPSRRRRRCGPSR